ncbi:hypothetical protein [Bradyrhizobium oligotrophicum]|uniref:hypothetical protein n=1 Tax=Bradyrhizobium oligotrophicum TaxID=44255 RepID=UPI003EC0EFA4
MQRVLRLGCVLLAIWIAGQRESEAGEGSAARIREVFAEAEYSNAASAAVDMLLSKQDARPCDFFGYRLLCTRRYLSLSEQTKVKSSAARAVPKAVRVLRKYDYPPMNRLTIVNAFRSSKDRDNTVQPVLVSAPYPGFIPFAAYDGTVSPTYDALNHSLEYNNEAPKPQQERFDKIAQDWVVGSMYDAKASDLKDIAVSTAPDRFETLLHKEFDFKGHDLFGDFADSRRVADGAKVVEFWENYVAFSKTADLRGCADLCSIAIELVSPKDHIRSIAHCSVVSVAGVAGSPENCYTVLTSDGKASYLRVSLYLNAVSGLDGIGGDEVSCEPVSALSKVDVDTLAEAVANDLRKVNTSTADPSYAVEISRKGANRTVLMATRYGLSAFFTDKTTWEISTTRVDIFSDEQSGITATVSLTAATSSTHSPNQDGYKLLQDNEATAMRRKVVQLLAPSFKCKTQRGT